MKNYSYVKTEKMSYGFKDFKNNPWPDGWVDSYNQFSEYLQNAIHFKNAAKIDFLLDQRHKFFCLCLELSAKEVSK